VRPGGGKAKGSAYERTVAAILAKAYYPDGDGKFQRIYSHPIPSKGQTRGDLVALRYFTTGPDEEKSLIKDSSWPFVVECKSYRDVRPIFSGLYASETALFDWMQQAAVVAVADKKIPLVVFKVFRSANVAMLDRRDFARLQEMFGIPGFSFYMVMWRSRICKGPIVAVGSEVEKALAFMLLADMLDWIDWGVYKLAGKGQYIRSLLPRKQER
jgi:hypothetical protein